jgi:hypothetical protein
MIVMNKIIAVVIIIVYISSMVNIQVFISFLCKEPFRIASIFFVPSIPCEKPINLTNAARINGRNKMSILYRAF